MFLASRFGMLTRVADCPFKQRGADRLRNFVPTLSCASAVEAPRCGVKIKFGAARSGESSGNGSIFKYVESAAPRYVHLQPLASAASSIKPPRAQLMMRTPGFVFEMRAVSRR